MIDNVMLLLKGTLSGRDVGELIAQCHPLGRFRDSTMRSIPAFENSPKGYADLYQTVLVDTPVGPYFSQFLAESSERLGSAAEVRNVLEEVELEVVKHSLMKLCVLPRGPCPRRRVAATPRPRRGRSAETRRGDAAEAGRGDATATTWRRGGGDAVDPRGRVAMAPWRRRVRRDAARRRRG